MQFFSWDRLLCSSAWLKCISFASVNTSLLLSCQTGLLKLACDYYYPPCHPMTFQQIPICGGSCKSIALVQTRCPFMVQDVELNVPSEVLNLDCSSSEGVTVSQDQCINLSVYSKLAVRSMMMVESWSSSFLYSNEFDRPNKNRWANFHDHCNRRMLDSLLYIYVHQ